ncbi:MAG: flavin reductase family protein [Chthonomonas sp.]|nr:flavin reductase family protein [Chthonomonas sp.]
MTSSVMADLSARDRYRLLANTVVPRPIALVSTMGANGVANLAPFSFFNVGGGDPASLVFCPGHKRDGSPKDTLRNIEETGEFVVNLVSRDMALGMNATAAELDADDSEWERAGFTPLASTAVAPARVRESYAHFECRLFEVVRHGPDAIYVIGEVLVAHIEEGPLPIARLGGAGYIDLAETQPFEIRRPG